jgi:Protein of unknown function (DUF3829)
MKRTFVATFVAGLALFVVAGCGGKGSGASGPEGLSKEAQADRELGQKLTAYVELGNRFFDRVYSSRRRYLSWVKDPQAGPTCKERHLYGLYTIKKTGKAAEKLQKANEMKPSLKKLEGAATKVLVALDKLDPMLQTAKRYYSQKDYKDDKCKKAQQMHPKLMGLFKEFEANEKIFSAIVSKTSQDLHQRLLGRIEKKHGKDHQRYYHKKVALDARSLLKFLTEGKSKEEAPAATKAIASFDKFVQEMDTNAKKGKEPSGYSSFRKSANSFVKACKERGRRIKSGKAYSKWNQNRINDGSGWMIKGSYAKVIKAFNSLIDTSNRVRH